MSDIDINKERSTVKAYLTSMSTELDMLYSHACRIRFLLSSITGTEPYTVQTYGPKKDEDVNSIIGQLDIISTNFIRINEEIHINLNSISSALSG